MICLDGWIWAHDLDLRVQIQIFCLNDLKLLGFGFEPNQFRILKAS
jgi:hypothetical protein